MRVWLGRSRHYAHACAKVRGHGLLAHARTRDTVRDMESLREALGQSTINFYGFSYGTYLGQVYATLHPTRVRRFVLDSNVDPRTVWYRANLNQDVAFDRNVKTYFHWLARYAGRPARVPSSGTLSVVAGPPSPRRRVLDPTSSADVFTTRVTYGWGSCRGRCVAVRLVGCTRRPVDGTARVRMTRGPRLVAVQLPEARAVSARSTVQVSVVDWPRRSAGAGRTERESAAWSAETRAEGVPESAEAAA